MVSHIKNSNVIFGAILITGLVGSAYEAYQINKISKVNHLIATEQLIKDEAYPYLQKFTAAYDQGNKKDYKHAVQTYGQILETAPSLADQAKIQYNIANNLFVFGLIRRINDDGTLQDEARYAYTQAKMAYEQSLRIEPQDHAAKFNLSLLYSVMANKMKPAPKDQSTMELSNLPIGLP
jgi:mxaK protein